MRDVPDELIEWGEEVRERLAQTRLECAALLAANDQIRADSRRAVSLLQQFFGYRQPGDLRAIAEGPES